MIHLINMTDWLDRAEALDALGIRAQTLYAYVSRGLIEARRAPGGRRSQYRAADVAALADRRGRSRASAAIAAGAMAWGEPSVVTAISTVHRGSLIYRGRDAVAFARDASLEATADLLWDSPEPTLFDVPAGAAATPFLALTALVRTAGLPRSAPFTIFLLGRSLGWAAHAMEQGRQGSLIRPRARYEGRRGPADRAGP
ncbi:hypothetical protein ABID82_001095 [Methylobacterium sp. PvP062]|uniref:Citrate synthase (unknown stereospecificity) n=1 Tax=Methylobacterium radiotolerans TaxID=31998 RepID=A0ABV2NFU4_9HYPH|nr:MULTISPECIES: citrate/2-methylcitrate synthase [unclassified Methylobacterium]MBP2497892.1 hypothetical protein [Methylobacterium sp. PvP105]MBP2502237.1 hypothetical protein [Methylobacterium sp. PvP109]MCX7334907.1 hypothetical protein [Hyphomicrobiales bacterium]